MKKCLNGSNTIACFTLSCQLKVNLEVTNTARYLEKFSQSFYRAFPGAKKLSC